MLFLCIVTVSALLISAIAVNAALVGDVADNDNKITANDARLILRASVNLETLTDEQAAIGDTDENGKLSAVDARTILRMSVELEDIRHFYNKEILTSPTCTEKGHYIATCTECDDVFEADSEALGHDWNIPEVTCTEDKYCTRCNGEITTKLGHTTDWGTCGNCKIFITEKYAEQASTIKTKTTEAIAATDKAYKYINESVGAASWLKIKANAAKPEYEKAKTAYEAAYIACADTPEFAAIKENLGKAIENTDKVLIGIDTILSVVYVDSSNYESLIEGVDIPQWANDNINGKLKKAIIW